ncbi:MAG: HAD family hydrolase, partial [Nannocystaceae bacterium]
MACENQRVAAFFDVDRTLIEVNSGAQWIRHEWRGGRISVRQLVRAMWWLTLYRMSRMDFEEVTAKATIDYAGRPVAAVESEVRAWFDQEIATWICKQGQAAVARHQQAGHIVALLTSGTRFSAQPLAERFGIEHVLCTELEAANGLLTGKHLYPACGGEGKIAHAEKFAAAHSIDMSKSYFYTDSMSDMPMLLRVGEPRVINPDPRLRRAARARGWQ